MAKIPMDLIQKLRIRTGLGMMDCKKALEESGGDMELAVKMLRKKGASVAAKRADKATSEGLVHAYIHPGNRIGVMVELNCETDFVARTEDLKKFAQNLCMHITALNPLYLDTEEIDPKLLERERQLYKEQMVDSGKPETIIDKIVAGKLNKFYSDICLLKQPFVKDDQKTVDDVLKELIAKTGEIVRIKRFARFEIGA